MAARETLKFKFQNATFSHIFKCMGNKRITMRLLLHPGPAPLRLVVFFLPHIFLKCRVILPQSVVQVGCETLNVAKWGAHCEEKLMRFEKF